MIKDADVHGKEIHPGFAPVLFTIRYYRSLYEPNLPSVYEQPLWQWESRISPD